MTLGAYSSRIVLSVGCAALTLLLASTCPTFGAPTARTAESLSAAERASLPDTTLIKLKTGRTVSLGVLRSEHKRRLQRFANASMLGKRASQLLTHGGGAPSIRSKSKKKGKKVDPGTLVPMNFSLKNFNLPAVLGPLPADMLAFCKAARVTACLYLPSGTPFVGPSFYMDYDYLITDAKQCTSEGGQTNFTSTMKMLGCSYYYPNQYILKFNPGPPTAQGYPVTHSATCPTRFVNYTVDPRGAVSLNIVSTSYVPSWGPINSLKTCVVRVFVKK
jgi:hypothetical protein